MNLLRLEGAKNRRRKTPLLCAAILAAELLWVGAYLARQDAEDLQWGWMLLLYNLSMVDAVILPLSVATLASRSAELEHRGNTWKLLETMQAEFPQIRVEGGPLYIQDEHIWTSGGVSSGFDLTLALVEEDYGFSLARDIAQDFVMYLRRPGGQLQFSRYNLQQTATQGPINDLLAWLLENLTADLSVDKLAEKVAMSPRNFTRVFTRETGASPARYVAEARLAAARQRLEQTHETLDRIAEQTGFGSSINLRRLFEKQLNLTPGEYRQRFHCRKMA